MNFFKKLFSKNSKPSDKDVSSIKPADAQASSPVKNIPVQQPKISNENDVFSIEPIVKQVIGHLFKTPNVQKKALKIIRKYNQERDSANTKTTLALLKYSNGDLALLEKSVWQSHPHFWMDEISPIFRTMEDAENWAKSLSEAQ